MPARLADGGVVSARAIVIEIAPEFIVDASVDTVRFVERELRRIARNRLGDEVAERGRVVWTAQLEVLPTERNDR